MQSSVPWYAESSEVLRARVAGIIPEPFAFIQHGFVNDGVPSVAATLVTRKRKKKSDRQEVLLQVQASNARAARALGMRRLTSRVPKPIANHEVNAVLFQQGMNMGSADAVAEKLRQRCVADVVISSASVDFLGKVVDSTLRITVGWQAYVEYTGYFFQYVPDGIFTLKSSETMVEDGENGDMTVVRSIYTFTGSLVVSSAVAESEPDNPSGASCIEDDANSFPNKSSREVDGKESCSLAGSTIERSEVGPIQKELNSVFLVDQFNDESGMVEITEALFSEDGLPTLTGDAEQELLQSPEFLVSSEDCLGITTEDESKLTACPDSEPVPSSDGVTSSSVRLSKTPSESSMLDSSQPPAQTSDEKGASLASQTKVVLKPKPAQAPKVQDEHVHNVFVDKEFDVAERFLITEASSNPTASSSTGKRTTEKRETMVPSNSNSDVDTSSSMSSDDSSVNSSSISTSPTPAPTVVASLDVIGAFNVYLNRQMQVEKLEFVYRNRLS